ncbi:MAG: CopD family protein [Nitrospinota bacterium]
MADIVANTLTVRFPEQPLAGAGWLYLTATRYGRFAGLRVFIAICMAWGAFSFLRHGRFRTGLVSLLLGLAGIATFSLSGHAASQGTGFTRALDLIHGGAVSLWAGGLISFALNRHDSLQGQDDGEQRRILAGLTRRFSWMAVATVAALLTTGVLLARNNLYGPEALLESPYGRPLGLKLLLTAVALTAAGVNLLVLRPLLADETKSPTARFSITASHLRTLVRVEAVCVLAALVAAGFLTAQSPTPAWGELRTRVTRVVDFPSMRATVALQPAAPRTVRISIFPQPKEAGSLPNAFDLDATMPGHDMGEYRARAMRRPGWRYVADMPLPMPGLWEIAVNPQGAEGQARVRFVAEGGSGYIPNYRFAPRAALDNAGAVAQAVLSLLLALAGGILIWAGQSRWWPLVASVVGAGLALFGAFGFLSLTYVRAYPTTYVRNPVPDAPREVEAGAKLFSAACMDCHGPLGRGDGPSAASLRALPDFADPHMESHRDGELYWWIRYGVSETQMPAYEDALSEIQTWQVVRFLRTLPSRAR